MANQNPTNNQEEIKAVIEASGEKNFERAFKKAKEQVDQLLHVSLNIAVTGESGVGKSTFINAIRELDNDNEGAAKTGVTETTTKPTPYPHPKLPNVTLWDLPGVGTTKFPAKTYLKKMDFDKYDFFIIISSERFKENNIMLAKNIRKMKKKFYFIRSKIDNDIRSEECKKSFSKHETLTKIRNDCLESLKECGNPKVFLISSMDLSAFDFEELVDALISEIPEHKQYALLQSVPVTSLAMLKKKVQMLKKLTWAVAVCCGGVAAIPIPGLSVGVDASIVLAFFTSCFYSFGLDNKSLQKLSRRVNKPNLKSLIQSPLVQELASQSVTTLNRPELAAGEALKFLCTMVPGVGSAVAALASFTFTRKLLKNGLKEFEDAAVTVLTESGLENKE